MNLESQLMEDTPSDLGGSGKEDSNEGDTSLRIFEGTSISDVSNENDSETQTTDIDSLNSDDSETLPSHRAINAESDEHLSASSSGYQPTNVDSDGPNGGTEGESSSCISTSGTLASTLDSGDSL